MAALLFESSDSLKIYSLDVNEKTVKVTMDNTDSLCEINLTLVELKLLGEWVEKQIDEIEEMNKPVIGR